MEKETAFQRWYRKNKDDFNQKRKERYHSDPDYRARMKAQSRRVAKESATLPNGVVSIGDAAKVIGREPYTIKNWEKSELIPEAVRMGRGRVYTQRQVYLMRALAAFLNANHHLQSGFKEGLSEVRAEIWSKWNGS